MSAWLYLNENVSLFHLYMYVDLSEEGIRNITIVLEDIDETSAELQRLAGELNDTLGNISTLVTQLQSDCMANATLSGSGVCDEIPDPDTFQLANDYSDVSALVLE